MRNSLLTICMCTAFAVACGAPSSGENSSELPMGFAVGAESTTWFSGVIQEDMQVALGDDRLATNVILVIDVSGSMNDKCGSEMKLTSAQSAAIEFIQSIPNDAALGLVAFGGRASVIQPIAFNQMVSVQDNVSQLRSGGGTPMGDAILISLNELARRGAVQQGYGTYHLVVLGDGSPDDVRQTVRAIDGVVNTTPINVHTIGFCADLSVLNRSGVNYYAAQNADELRSAFRSVLAESEDLPGADSQEF